MTLEVGAVAIVDDACLWFPHDATTALRTCLAAVVDSPHRAGLHWGIAVANGSEVVGRAVDIARRLAAVARPGEVVVSCAALRRVDTDPDVDEIGLVEIPDSHLPLAVVHFTPTLAQLASFRQTAFASGTPVGG